MMSKSQLIKEFDNLFFSLSRKYGSYSVFEDYLYLFINSFSFSYGQDLDRIKKTYIKEERIIFGELIKKTLLIQNKMIQFENDWHDFFGGYYEKLSLTKEKGFAQYFTPKPICIMMAKCVTQEKKRRFLDVACGSGRMSLAFNSGNYNAFHVLVDIDLTCAKMASLNLMLHGIRGIVISDNGLAPSESFKGAFIINQNLHKLGVPSIEYTKSIDKAYFYAGMNSDLKYFNDKGNNYEKKVINLTKTDIIKKGKQFKLF